MSANVPCSASFACSAVGHRRRADRGGALERERAPRLQAQRSGQLAPSRCQALELQAVEARPALVSQDDGADLEGRCAALHAQPAERVAVHAHRERQPQVCRRLPPAFAAAARRQRHAVRAEVADPELVRQQQRQRGPVEGDVARAHAQAILLVVQRGDRDGAVQRAAQAAHAELSGQACGDALHAPGAPLRCGSPSTGDGERRPKQRQQPPRRQLRNLIATGYRR
jgi:hypothetical protein